MDGVSTSSEEQKYVKLFQSVDLSTDFYFSYSYDMSRTFQENSLRSDWNNHGQRRLEADERFLSKFLFKKNTAPVLKRQNLFHMQKGVRL